MPVGRPPKLGSKKQLEGDQPCRDRVEPVPPPGGVGPCPDHLDEHGSRCWRRLERILTGMGVLTSADADALMILCSNYSLWKRAHEEITRDGLTVPTQFSTKPHPMLAVVNRCEAVMGKMLGEFGMTPVARRSLDLGKKGDDDEFDKWVKAGQKGPDASDKTKPAGG